MKKSLRDALKLVSSFVLSCVALVIFPPQHDRTSIFPGWQNDCRRYSLTFQRTIKLYWASVDNRTHLLFRLPIQPKDQHAKEDRQDQVYGENEDQCSTTMAEACARTLLGLPVIFHAGSDRYKRMDPCDQNKVNKKYLRLLCENHQLIPNTLSETGPYSCH